MASKPIDPIIQELMDLIQSQGSRIRRGSDVSHAGNPSRASRARQICARLLIVSLVLSALAQTDVRMAAAQAASDANVTKQSVACPSQDFKEFLAAFSENADLQRRYT